MHCAASGKQVKTAHRANLGNRGAAKREVMKVTMDTDEKESTDAWAEYEQRVRDKKVWQDLGATKEGKKLQTEWKKKQKIWTLDESLLDQWMKAPTSRAILRPMLKCKRTMRSNIG